jgi:hypothetical protein
LNPAQTSASTTFFVDRAVDERYEAAVSYLFDPRAGWDASSNRYVFPFSRRTGRTIPVVPADDFRFREVRFEPHQVDFGGLEILEVNATVTTATGATLTKRFSWGADAREPVTWRLRLDQQDPSTVSYRTTARLPKGVAIEGTMITTDSTAVLVEDPFVDSLTIDFFHDFGPAEFEAAFLVVDYDDRRHRYSRSERIELDLSTRRTTVRIALRDSTKRTFSYRAELVPVAGNPIQLGPITTAQPVIRLAAPQRRAQLGTAASRR